jgi:hypothetical protein
MGVFDSENATQIAKGFVNRVGSSINKAFISQVLC